MPDNDQLELKYIPLGTISKWTDNYKKHDIGTLVRSIRKHGFRDPLSFDKNLNKGKGGIVEGNGRDDALAAMFRQDPEKPPRGISILKGEWLIPVLFGLDAESQGMAEAYGIDHNNITLLGGDFELADLMRQWDKGHEQQLMELAELDELPVSIDADLLDVLLGTDEPKDAEPQIDRAEALQEKWQVQTGDLWKIGQHKLICGDCTDPAVVERLMAGEKATMTFIDPPYNALKSWNKDEAHSETRLDPAGWFDNDNLEWDEYWLFIDNLFKQGLLGHSVYVCCDFRIYDGIKPAIESNGYKTKHCIVWKKNVWGLGKRYRFQHEFVVYACNDKAPFHGDRSQSDVWELDIKITTDHKTPKPVELPQKAIVNSSLSGEIVFDGCVGHGTTLVACENLNRKARGVEISEKYVSVCLQRMQDAFPDLPIEKL